MAAPLGGLAGDARSLQALRSDAARDPKVAAKEAAKQFEALFMQELMKSMRAAQVGTGVVRQRCQPHGHRDARCADGHVVRRPAGRSVGHDRQAARAPDGAATPGRFRSPRSSRW